MLLWTCQQNSTMHTTCDWSTWTAMLQGLQTGPVGRNLSARAPGYCQCHCNWWASWELLDSKRSSRVIPEEPWCCSSSFVEIQLWNSPIPVRSDRKPKPHVHGGKVAVPLAAWESQQLRKVWAHWLQPKLQQPGLSTAFAALHSSSSVVLHCL